ncbi:auxin-induced protein 15A-like [Typha angustifolia]|uniref:auxin-induced protein 15A-like n=1 Tax=Typha angustifolia TaxID=59011 RepID=UPI003C2B1B0D
MGLRLPRVDHAMQMFQRSLSWKQTAQMVDVPKGYLPIYVGQMEKRFVIPVSYLRHPLLQSLLDRAEEEFGLDHATGGIRVPCEEDDFVRYVRLGDKTILTTASPKDPSEM